MIRLAFSLTLVLQMLLASSSSFAARSVPSMVQRRRMPLWRGGSSIPNDGDDSTNPFSRIGSSPEDPPPTIDGSVDAANPTFTASPILTTAEQSSPDFNHSGAVVGASTKNTSSTRTPGFLRSQFPNFPWHSIPNWLTFLRCLAVPALLAAFYAPGPHSRVATSTLFATAAATDFLDGYLARRWDVSSAFGAFLDPVADKLMVSTCLILLSGRYGARVAIPASLILARELSVSALREWMAEQGLRDIVQVGYQGKVKTALTMVAMSLLLLVPEDISGAIGKLLGPSLYLLYLCTAITISSGSVYFLAAAPYFVKARRSSAASL